MNNENLVPNQIKTTERARELGRKGGLVKSQNKRIAARMRELRAKGLKDETINRLVGILEDSDLSALDIALYLEQIRASAVTPRNMIDLANARINLHRIHHGEKHKVESSNMNLNVNLDLVKFQELMKQYQKEETK